MEGWAIKMAWLEVLTILLFPSPGKKQIESLDHFAFSRPGKKQIGSLTRAGKKQNGSDFEFAYSQPEKKQNGSDFQFAFCKLAWLSRLFVHGGLGATKTGSLDHFAFSQPGKIESVGREKANAESESNWENQFISGLQSKIKELWPNG